MYWTPQWPQDFPAVPYRTAGHVAAIVAALTLASVPTRADHMLLQVEDFEGPWRRQTNISGYIGTGFCTSNANPKVAETAMTKTVRIADGGKHAIWARGYTSSNSRRAFRLQVGDTLFDKTHAQRKREWSWQRAGEVDLPAGEVSIAVRDADNGFESVDAVLVTNRLDFDPDAELRRWKLFPEKLPETANAIHFNIQACHKILQQHKPPATKAEWESKRKGVHRELAEALGLHPMPERTPLNAKITGRTERDDYVIENLVFESRPNFYVTAVVYVPKRAPKPAPAVVVVPGHAMKDGKNYHLYMLAQLGLVRQGFIVLAYDPIGQGERRLPGFAHTLGYGSLLVGQTNEGMITWDTIRAVDYLCARDDVDKDRLGLAGNSGGGENTFYALPFEPRFKTGTSFCFVCSYDQFLLYGGNHCICNHLPGIVHHMEEFQIIGLNVPRPFLFGNGAKDKIFPIKGVRDTHRWAQQIYALYGVRDRVVSVEVPLGHGWSKPLREVCYGWMKKWLRGEGDGSPVPEPEMKHDEPDSPVLMSFKDGKMPEPAETVVTLNRKRAEELRAAYADPPASKQAWTKRAGKWREDLWRCFGGEPDAFAPQAKRVKTFYWKGRRVETMTIRTEPGMDVAAVLVLPKQAKKRCPAVIYLGLADKTRILSDRRMQEVLEGGSAILMLDPRGLGEAFVHENHLTSDSICLGRHIFAQRVWDVMQAVRVLAGRADIDASRIRCFGTDGSGLLGVFAAALGSPLEAVACAEPLASYRFFLEDDQPQPIWLAVPNLLKVTDVAQAIALAAPTRMMIVNPVGFGEKPLPSSQAREEMDFAARAYDLLGKPNRFELVTGDPQATEARLTAFLDGSGPW